ncbi:TetR/AcrR family transcriptional regulator [Paenibacillus glycanilyticus]|uniref:TetR/AcrR family transcriptional regulator n=1 Tax=Paenibacillus glycanilyticus TaxID=126569 RepID=UPI002041CD53|nr:TetR/AcrR family transcriptional regulator [Paenibacillus glycanilyticus]MCM3630282.1 TetR/AcrR family transcriptional regulator [Paenibacillus glycanilyticus]
MTPREKDFHAVTNRKEQILDAAASLFANNGYYKTTTGMVAAEVGVTQPYVFHFFKTKEVLYLAVLERAQKRLMHAFSTVEAPPEFLHHQMGNAFNELMAHYRDETLLCMQSYTTPEPNVREIVRQRFAEVHQVITERFERAGMPNPSQQASTFIACGMVITMSEILELPVLGDLGHLGHMEK